MSYTFNNIAGYEKEKEELKRLCDIFNNKEKYEKKGAKLPKGIIFYGEAGSGKTLFSKVLANECGLDVMKIDVSDIDDEFVICKNIKMTFKDASLYKKPVMIFFDELDKFLPNNSEKYVTDRSKTILVQLLTLIDGMNSSNNIIFVATCNDYYSLPETIIRPGRIDKKISINSPNFNSRVEILKYYAQKSSCKFETSFEDIAKMCMGFSCSSLETFINECVLQSDENGFVDKNLVLSKIYEIKNEDIPKKKSKIDDIICAVRNLGYFMVAKEFSSEDYDLNLSSNTLCNEFFSKLMNSFDDDDEDEDYEDDNNNDYINTFNLKTNCTIYRTKNDYFNLISVIYGGYISQNMIFNKIYDCRDYINRVDDILLFLSRYGMLGINYIYDDSRNRDLCYTSYHIDKINEKFTEIKDKCYETAQNIISKKKELIQKIIPILVENQHLKKEECDDIIYNLTNNH